MPLTSVPDIIDHWSPNNSARKAGVRVDTVLIHHTATHSDATGGSAAVSWLCKPGSWVSAHYVVDYDGRILRLVPEHLKAWHAGMGRLPWETCPEYDFNHRSIGIEVVNPGDGKTPFTEAQYRALAWLVPDIVRRHDAVPAVGPRELDRLVASPRDVVMYVIGHRDVAPGRKTDPADNFDWARIREALAGGAT
jgi:N-acetylmuramoyl-L-alanine amidase